MLNQEQIKQLTTLKKKELLSQREERLNYYGILDE